MHEFLDALKRQIRESWMSWDEARAIILAKYGGYGEVAITACQYIGCLAPTGWESL